MRACSGTIQVFYVRRWDGQRGKERVRKRFRLEQRKKEMFCFDCENQVHYACERVLILSEWVPVSECRSWR